jgi:hypothetical protein
MAPGLATIRVRVFRQDLTVAATPAFYKWCEHHEVKIGDKTMPADRPAEWLGRALLLWTFYNMFGPNTAGLDISSLRDEHGHEWHARVVNEPLGVSYVSSSAPLERHAVSVSTRQLTDHRNYKVSMDGGLFVEGSLSLLMGIPIVGQKLF